MICTSARTGNRSCCRREATSLLLTPISPASGRSSRATQRATVDLPEPELPTKASVFPCFTSKLTSCAAVNGTLLRNVRRRSQYLLLKPCTRSTTPGLDRDCASVAIFEAAHAVGLFLHRFVRGLSSTDLHAFRAAR